MGVGQPRTDIHVQCTIGCYSCLSVHSYSCRVKLFRSARKKLHFPLSSCSLDLISGARQGRKIVFILHIWGPVTVTVVTPEPSSLASALSPAPSPKQPAPPTSSCRVLEIKTRVQSLLDAS